MDTTEKYIKMCEKAEEIQGLLDEEEDGNYLYVKKTQSIKITGHPWFYWLENYGNGNPCQQWVSYYWESDSPDYYGQDVVWLPRQDQLQEMIAKPKYNLAKLRAITHFIMNEYGISIDWSMEQLWLAFVMKERWNKVWDGEKWEESVKD